MAAEEAEAKLTELLRGEVVKVEKSCIRPLQVSKHVWVMHESLACRWKLFNAVPNAVKISTALKK